MRCECIYCKNNEEGFCGCPTGAVVITKDGECNCIDLSNILYDIYTSTPSGMEYTGIFTHTREEAEYLCALYDKQYHNPYIRHVIVEKKNNP